MRKHERDRFFVFLKLLLVSAEYGTLKNTRIC